MVVSDMISEFRKATTQPWWQRHAVLSGAVAGAVVGFGVYFVKTRSNPYCHDPDMIPCEVSLPLFAVSGGALGAGLGYLISRTSPSQERKRADGIRATHDTQ